MNIYSGIKILDLTKVFSGPFATRHFADFGAEVIKIESTTGDDSRYFAPKQGDWSGYFELLNRNKSSLVLDLKIPEDLASFYILCRDADVIVENFSPRVKQKLKISYEDIAKIHPAIVYASLSGISERVDRKYYDVIAQAESGLTSLNGETSDMKIATSVTDAFAGMKLAYAISSALFERSRSGKGCHISVSMLGCTFDLLEQNLIEASVTGKNPNKVGNMDSAIAPFGLFKTHDGYIALAIGNDAQWHTFSNYFAKQFPRVLNQGFVNNSERLRNLYLLKNTIEDIFSSYTTERVFAMLQEIGIPSGISRQMLDVISNQQNFDEGLLQKITHPMHGTFVVSNGGISYSSHKQETYRFSPTLPKKLS